jgi:hypothetical protein
VLLIGWTTAAALGFAELDRLLPSGWPSAIADALLVLVAALAPLHALVFSAAHGAAVPVPLSDAQVADVHCALRWLQSCMAGARPVSPSAPSEELAELRLLDGVCIVAHSSGAHVAARALDQHARSDAGVRLGLLRSAVLFSGVYDLRCITHMPWRQLYLTPAFGTSPPEWARWSACGGGACSDVRVPILLAFGARESAALFHRGAADFAARLIEAAPARNVRPRPPSATQASRARARACTPHARPPARCTPRLVGARRGR